MESVVWIQHPEGRRLLALREAQRETLELIRTEKRVVILKARQLGFTTLMGAFVLWLAMFSPEQSIVLLSRTEREAQDFLRKIRYAYDGLPDWLKDRAPALLAATLQKLEFANRSIIESLPSKENPARGRTVTLVVVDEWAFLENPEDAWASIQPIADIGGKIIGLSTANGAGNFFEKLWNGAKSKINGFVPIFFPWSAVPERDDAWYEATRRSFTADWQMHQEYPTTPEEAFIKSGRSVFDVELLRGIETVRPRIGYLSVVDGQRNFPDDDNGNTSLWQVPQPGHIYAIGVDVAEGLEHGDFSSAHVLDARTGLVAAHAHGHMAPDVFAEDLDRLGRWYNNALIGVEAQMSGGSVCLRLQQLNYPRLYYRRNVLDRNHRVTNQVGWWTSRTSKAMMIDDLASALRNDELHLKDEPTIYELIRFVRDDKGRMAGSPYDDRVMSLAIAQQMRQVVFSPEYSEQAGFAVGTLGWYMEQMENDHETQGLIGAHSVRVHSRWGQ